MFKQRSDKKELLDAENIPEKDLFINLKELHIINKYLGGYQISKNALKSILDKNNTYSILDIGSGGGDTLKEIFKWGNKNKYNLNLYGLDLKQSCINYSLINSPINEIQFICDDYLNINTHLKEVNIIHACLFCHHLSEREIIDLIQFAQLNNSILVINDLERNPFAYYSIKFLTQLFSNSYLVKNDAPLSVLRGFKRKEWISILEKSGNKSFSLKYKWAFRYELIIYPNESR
jgi:2-polyprenyl-3-methyl-5-hydroxy-6-metoxy-1,4-benzoquinol methylase